MFLVFDTETTGLPKRHNAPWTETDNWPRCVQIAWQLHNDDGSLLEHADFLIRPDGFNVPYEAEQIHGISNELASLRGVNLRDALDQFQKAVDQADFVTGHNVGFDISVVRCELFRCGIDSTLESKMVLDTCTRQTADLCKLPGGRGGGYKYPTLSELHTLLFDQSFQDAHNATADVEASARCVVELIRLGHVAHHIDSRIALLTQVVRNRFRTRVESFGLSHQNLKEESRKLKPEATSEKQVTVEQTKQFDLSGVSFCHLHNHTQFSVLQSTSSVKRLIQAAGHFGCPAVSLTDSGNMMAAFQFVSEVKYWNEKKSDDQQKLKAIVGCEFNVCSDRNNKSEKDNGYRIVILAKNKAGYHGLAKMASIAYTEGFYYVPRIDKSVITEYRQDLICLTGNLNGEVPALILNSGEAKAEQALLWWKDQFGRDLYIELNRHGLQSEKVVNETLIRFSEKHGVKVVATNDTFYLRKEEANAQDILVCVKEGELKSTPVGRGRGFRYGLENDQYYFKSPDEMKALFADIPEAIESTIEIAEKCEEYSLSREILLPAFDLPEEFRVSDGASHQDGENKYLKYLTYRGAEKRYGSLTPELTERIDFELETIANTGYPGYFLIVQDLCDAARKMGVSVGPGRGSAAGSVVAYCTWITNVDPIKYQLLFERFLNPERVSMPDIDIDFDDEGRQLVIDWVINKYGSRQVAQIVTYGTMAAKSAIRDTARVLDLPLHEADRLAKLVPTMFSFAEMFSLDHQELSKLFNNNQEDIAKIKELKEISKGKDLQAEVVRQAILVEGSMRNTGTHACGVIITPGDITDYVPVSLVKDSEMVCTQYDNDVAEKAGLLKMDFLGLSTLTKIKHAVKLIRENHGIDLDPDQLPLDDKKTYELFQRGETVGIFQYESPGMQKYLKDLKPTLFGDLIALNALYRPGPIEYIPAYIRRKNRLENIVYDIDATREVLEETYGVTVYQEQVMLLSQKLSGFTKGQADTLRKAMGKKNFALMAQMKSIFVEQGCVNGHDRTKLEKLWSDWEAFAEYAFNKSHSTCYAWIAYQTAYLKANYPAEYMASILSNSIGNIKEVSFLMEECRRIGIPVLGPDVNESGFLFSVNAKGAIRFGLGAIKGVGSKPAEVIINERQTNGPFRSVFDFISRVDLRACNKRVLESLVLAGGVDGLGQVNRASFFADDGSGKSFVENLLKYGARVQEGKSSSQTSLFGESSFEAAIPEPSVPAVPEWPVLVKLNKEREVVGMFISGHPLDDYKLEIKSFTNANIASVNDLEKNANRELRIAGIVTSAEHRTTKHGKMFGAFEIEDYQDVCRLLIFGEDYMKFKHLMAQGVFVYITGRAQKRRHDDALEFRISTMELLPELREKLSRYLMLEVESSELTNENSSELHKILKQHKGKCLLRMVIKDAKTGAAVKMPSRTMKVSVDNEVINKVKSLQVFDVLLSQN